MHESGKYYDPSTQPSQVANRADDLLQQLPSLHKAPLPPIWDILRHSGTSRQRKGNCLLSTLYSSTLLGTAAPLPPIWDILRHSGTSKQRKGDSLLSTLYSSTLLGAAA
jgi:hypothetical protein